MIRTRTLLHRYSTAALIAATWPIAMALPMAAQAQQAFPIAVPQTPDPLLQNLAIPSTAAEQGMWSTTINWPLVPIHVAVLPDGRVVSFGAPVNGTVQDGRQIAFWDPRLGTGSNSFTVSPNAQGVDSFCADAVLMPNGSLLVSGGSSIASGYSSRETMMLNSQSGAITRGGDLTAPRWYGTMIALADGRQMMTGGGAPYAIVGGYQNPSASAPNISSTPEIYSPATGWQSLLGAYSLDAFGAQNNRAWYPRQWVAPNGKVFGISTDKMWVLDPTGNGSIQTVGNFKTTVDPTAKPNVGPTSSAVMYDVGKILQIGGNGYANGYASPSSNLATIIDINGAAPVLTETAPMANPRQWGNATVLPNGLVLATGGSTYGDDSGTSAVYQAEIWNPATGRWTRAASAANYRGYHSMAALLPDGVVMVGGGGIPGPVVNQNVEFYYPPYLFQRTGGRVTLAKRPKPLSMSASAVDYGRTLTVQMSAGDDVAQVALTRLSSITHSFDSGQRRIKAAFTRSGSTLTVTMPASGNIAPPGYYNLYMVSSTGVPSSGIIIGLHAAAPPATAGGTAAPSAPAQIGVRAASIAAASDGTMAIANTSQQAWVSQMGNNWTQLPGNFIDIAAIGANRYYAVGTDGNVYRWGGTNWAQVGVTSKAITASSDGAVAVINSNTGTVWLKNNDDTQPTWTQVPGATAGRIALVSRKSLYFRGTDGNVYHSDTVNPPVQVGTNVTDIAASADGSITVVSGDGTIWQKNTDDNQTNWVQRLGTAVRVATPNAGSLVTVDAGGNIFSQ